MSPAPAALPRSGRPPPTGPPPVPDVVLAIDRLVLDDPAIDPGRASRLQRAIEQDVAQWLEEHGWEGREAFRPGQRPAIAVPRVEAPPPGASDADIVQAVRAAVAAALERHGGPHVP